MEKIIDADDMAEGDENAYLDESDFPYDSIDGCPRVRLQLGDGGEMLAHAAVVATEAPAAVQLLGKDVLNGSAIPSRGRSSTCLYFAIDGPAPVGIILNRFLKIYFLTVCIVVVHCACSLENKKGSDVVKTIKNKKRVPLLVVLSIWLCTSQVATTFLQHQKVS